MPPIPWGSGSSKQAVNLLLWREYIVMSRVYGRNMSLPHLTALYFSYSGIASTKNYQIKWFDSFSDVRESNEH